MSTTKHTAKPLRCGIYHRVSTLDQDSSLASDELRAAAMFRGMEVVLAVEETGSGAKNSRPGLQKVMNAAKQGEIDVIMVWKLDRFGRSSLDLLSNINKLESYGVEFVDGHENPENSDPPGRGVPNVSKLLSISFLMA